MVIGVPVQTDNLRGGGDILSSEAACLTRPSLQVHCPKTMVSYGMFAPEIRVNSFLFYLQSAKILQWGQVRCRQMPEPLMLMQSSWAVNMWQCFALSSQAPSTSVSDCLQCPNVNVWGLGVGGYSSHDNVPSHCVQVNLHRDFIFRHSKHTYNGIPIIASNMDTVGTFEMAKSLAKVSQI